MKRIVNDDNDGCSVADYLEIVGDMMNEYNLSTDDLQEIVDTYPNDWDVEKYVKGQLDFDLKQKTETDKLEDFLKESGVSDIKKFWNGLHKLGYYIS